MKLCKDCDALIGRPLLSTGRHAALTTYYGRRLASDQDGPVLYQYYQCEDCGAVVCRQKAPPTPNGVWQLVPESAVTPEPRAEEAENDYAFVFNHAGGSIVAH